MPDLYPMLLERRLSRRLWGGERLAGYLGVELPREGEPLAEAWQIYAENRVVNGPLAGKTLTEVAAEAGARLLGTASVARYGRRVPLLAKFIDAAQPLSIQVHPDDEFALSREADSGHLGKAEAWYILDCEPGAWIIWGFSHPIGEELVRRAVAEGSLEEHVNHVTVKPGDVIYNPAGTVHAIGAGIFLFEIQQASDLTYRLYDYRRKGADGRERELHLDKALEVADLSGGPMPRVAPLEVAARRRLLVETPHFAMEALEPLEGLQLATSAASLELLTVTRGSARLEYGPLKLDLLAGVSAVLPAAMGEYRLVGDGEMVRCYLPVG